jgi:hypothetical protein
VEEPCGAQENIGNVEHSWSRRHITIETSTSVYSVINYVELFFNGSTAPVGLGRFVSVS